MSTPSHVIDREPQCVTLHDAIATRFELVMPAEAPDLASRHTGFGAYTRGCLYDADGARIDLSVRAGGVGDDAAMSIDPAVLPPEQRGGTWLAGRTLFLGTIMNGYGQFITEGLSRYWRKESTSFKHFVAYPFIHDQGQVLLQGFHRHLAELLDVPLDRTAILRSQMVFDEIVVPEQLWTHNVAVNSHMREIYDGISARHAGKASSGRIFLSREVSPRLGNVLAVEEIFASYGFRVLYPEQMDMADQLSVYANCEILAGLSGSAMHNCLFARPGLMTIEVGDARARREPMLMQRMANELAQVDARFIPFGDRDDIRINPAAVKRGLRDILGELPRRGPVLMLRLKRRMAGLKTRSKPAERVQS